ncbi:hypothetical protein AMTRI_Chr03g51110 [Amborella trichopoda]
MIVVMKENSVMAGNREPMGRITRARASASGLNSGPLLSESPNVQKENRKGLRGTSKKATLDENSNVFPSKPNLRHDKKWDLRGTSKRSALDENHVGPSNPSLQYKRRAVLRDVSNICCESRYMKCMTAAKPQIVNRKEKTRVPPTKGRKISNAAKSLPPSKGRKISNASKSQLQVVPVSSHVSDNRAEELKEVQDDLRSHMAIKDYKSKLPEKHESTCASHITLTKQLAGCMEIGESKPANGGSGDSLVENLEEREISSKHCNTAKGNLYEDSGSLHSRGITEIDCDCNDPSMCCMYAPDIYNYLRVAERNRRPTSNFMETVQRDITQNMRGILIDWLVEVAEEYKLVPDTLYLTVYLIDRFLSGNLVERQKLQLLGVTCMLLASKYEEICAPSVADFCYTTDNTYSKEEVLNMETRILNYLKFQLTVPTTKTFLRRFLRASQGTFKEVSSLSLEFLANYLAELTLIEYSFLTFLPSLIAAAAVFLARWMLDPSRHPWNRTLEHYTGYKALNLKTMVFALHDLQINRKGCTLNAIREKYRQSKFQCVANLPSPELLQTLFS